MTGHYPIGARVRRTIVTEGVVVRAREGRTDDGQYFGLNPESYADLSTVTIEVLSVPEPVEGSVVLFPAYGTVAERLRSGWVTTGSAVVWNWDQLIAAVGPDFEILKQGDSQ